MPEAQPCHIVGIAASSPAMTASGDRRPNARQTGGVVWPAAITASDYRRFRERACPVPSHAYPGSHAPNDWGASTLGAQFFFEWLFLKFSWFYNGNSSATISLAHGLSVFGLNAENPHGRYWLTLGTVSSSDSGYVSWQYLNGSTVMPATGLANATVQFIAPSTPGSYQVRLFLNGGWTRIATSVTLTVQ